MNWVYLASQSPRRRELLTTWGINTQVLSPLNHEAAEALEIPQPHEDPRVYVQRVTHNKSQAAWQRWQTLPNAIPMPILCADTTVDLKGQLLGKPQDAQEAYTMLTQLSGCVHQVHTCVMITLPRVDRLMAQHQPLSEPWVHVVQAVSTSKVHFSSMTSQEIEDYIASGEPFGKAGSYGIQGMAARWICHLEGSYSGVMGLPAFETMQLLKQLNYFNN